MKEPELGFKQVSVCHKKNNDLPDSHKWVFVYSIRTRWWIWAALVIKAEDGTTSTEAENKTGKKNWHLWNLNDRSELD